jgi:hypothetical protein
LRLFWYSLLFYESLSFQRDAWRSFKIPFPYGRAAGQRGAIKLIILYLEEIGVPSMDTLEEIAKREREEARLEGVREGERKENLKVKEN